MIFSKAIAQDSWTDQPVRRTVAVNLGKRICAIRAISASTCHFSYKNFEVSGGRVDEHLCKN
jgi:hypothetical protein